MYASTVCLLDQHADSVARLHINTTSSGHHHVVAGKECIMMVVDEFI